LVRQNRENNYSKKDETIPHAKTEIILFEPIMKDNHQIEDV